MKFLLGALIAALALVVVTSETNCTRNGVSCPNYEVLEVHEDYEKRRYPEVTLVSTTGQARQRKTILRKLIMRLYRYIGGYNSEGREIELMVPVRTWKFPGQDFNIYTVSFFLPKEFSDNPPTPLDHKVTVQKEPVIEYAVRSFGGVIRNESVWDKEVQTVFDNLPQVQSNDYFWAVYDPPVIHRNRLNEVWVQLTSEQETEEEESNNLD